MFSRALQPFEASHVRELRVFPRFLAAAAVVCSLAIGLAPVACLHALGTCYKHSGASKREKPCNCCQPVTRFPSFNTGYRICRAFRSLQGFPRLAPVVRLPALSTNFVFVTARHRPQVFTATNPFIVKSQM